MINACPNCSGRFAGGEIFCPADGTRLKKYSVDTSKSGDDSDPLIGVTFGARYRIIRRIGEGGMGVVYEAEHLFIENRVAIKVLRFELRSRSNVVERFRQEAKSASHIGHPNIVAVTDFGETPEGFFYYVMEKLEGVDLAEILYRERALPPARAVRLAVQCCRALGAAHAKGIVHRDVKPENIFVMQADGADFVKIVDFGVAKMNDVEVPGKTGRKLTKTGMIFGTPEYMAPEHATGKPLDHRADIYALGIILYETLTGWLPFEGDNFMEVLHKHANQPLRPLREKNPFTRVSAELEATIFKALEKDPNKRFQNMEAMAKALVDTPEMQEVLKRRVTDRTTTSQTASPLVTAAANARFERRSSVQTTVHRATPAEREIAHPQDNVANPAAPVDPATGEKPGGNSAAVIRGKSRKQVSYTTLKTLVSTREVYERAGKIAMVGLVVAACAALVVLLGGRLSARGGAMNASSTGSVATIGVSALSESPFKSPRARPDATASSASTWDTWITSSTVDTASAATIWSTSEPANKTINTPSSTRPGNEPTRARKPLTPLAVSAQKAQRIPAGEREGDKDRAHRSTAVASRENGAREDLVYLIAVHVATAPEGARLTVIGRGRVCHSTPCEFKTPSDDEITLLAELNGVRTVKTIRPKESPEVSITLSPAADSIAKSPETPVATPRHPSDLKVPEIFR